MDNIVTALGVVVACEEVVRMRKFGDPLENLRISIEGFGKVGTGIARIIHGRAKLVAVSTRYGTIAEPEGFDIKQLLQLQSQYGDHFIDHVDSEIMGTERLFSIPTDIIIPGARTEVITKKIAKEIIKIRPRAIVPVSNYPYTKEALDIFHHSGILAFPDFIASAGAIIAGMVEFAQAGGQKEALDLVHAAITTETRQILMAAKACTDYNKSMYEIAVDRALSDKQRLLEESKSMSIQQIAKDLIQRYLPDLLKP
jgi:glutamate dehydrogenase/leucine dehydrogenase